MTIPPPAPPPPPLPLPEELDVGVPALLEEQAAVDRQTRRRTRPLVRMGPAYTFGQEVAAATPSPPSATPSAKKSSMILRSESRHVFRQGSGHASHGAHLCPDGPRRLSHSGRGRLWPR